MEERIDNIDERVKKLEAIVYEQQTEITALELRLKGFEKKDKK